MNLHLGCGRIHYEGCINVDVKPLKTVDIVADIRQLPFQDKCADTVIVHHCFEHIPRQKTYDTLREWYRVLKNGGMLDIEMPDFDQNCRDYVQALDNNDFDKQTVNKNFIYGGDSSALEDGHRWGYGPRLMEGYLKEIGFTQMDRLVPAEFHRDQAASFRIRAVK